MADIKNRDLGEIYTPKCVSDMLREQVEESLPGFESKFLIWDSCWGEGNLTKSLNASDLWCSTLREQDITDNISEKGNKFVYDFLNEDCECLRSIQSMWGAKYENLPKHIVEVLEQQPWDEEPLGNYDKPILFYINPPYVSNSIFGANNTDFRDVEISEIRNIMSRDKLGMASQQAYIQFMYRILKMKQLYKNKRIYIALVSPVNYMQGNSFMDFRREWLKEFKFMSGRLMKASTFKGLSDRWAISTTLWGPVEELGENTDYDKHNFKCTLVKSVGEDAPIISFGTKILYNIDFQNDALSFVNEGLLVSNLVDAPLTCSSGAVVSNKKTVQWDRNALGFVFFKGNNVYHNITDLGLLSVPYSDGSGISITEHNAWNALTFFTSKGAVGGSESAWSNNKDESLYPDISHPDFKKLQMNSIIFSLFNPKTAFCEMDFPEGHIVNNFDYEDESRLGYKMLHEALDSGLVLDSGLAVLNKAREIKESLSEHMVKGSDFDKAHPEYQVWQEHAGFYQWKFILKDMYKDKYKEFRGIYITFLHDIKNLVYNVGFYRNRAVDFDGNFIE